MPVLPKYQLKQLFESGDLITQATLGDLIDASYNSILVGGTNILLNSVTTSSGTTITINAEVPLNGGYLAKITDVDTGYGIAERVSTNYGDIGDKAVDLSNSLVASIVYGATGASSFAAGQQTIASGTYSTVGGGRNSTASGAYSSVGGGIGNSAGGEKSTVSGGANNTASEYQSTVGGGQTNTASGYQSTVGGGQTNIASGYQSTVGGGQTNTTSGFSSTVGGGYGNTASGGASVVTGGRVNVATADFSSILGGAYNNTSTFVNSHIIGSNITSNRINTTFVQNLSITTIPTASAGLPSGSVWSNGGVLNIV